MKKPNVKPVNRAREFAVDELFYSTTDRRGVIQTGNDVFYRVAAYAEAELIGQPHNIIRHPDMPRAGFQLLWEHLLADKPAAVYVKNLAKDGGYYWVFALVAPIEGGFVSLRAKPCASVFTNVQALYSEMLAVEARRLEDGDTPAEAMKASRKVLDDALRKLGFGSYEHFMRAALLPAEFAARKAELGGAAHRSALPVRQDEVIGVVEAARADLERVITQLHTATSRLTPVLARNTKTTEASRALSREAQRIGLTAKNVSLKAVQLGAVGRGTGVIAGYLSDGAKALRERVHTLAERLAVVSARLEDIVVESGWGEVEYEMVLRAFDEVAAGHAGHAAGHEGADDVEATERRILGLERLRIGVMGTRTRMLAALAPFLQALQGIDALSDSATELAIGLGAALVGGRVESARLPERHSMDGILGDLKQQLDEARARLVDIKNSVSALGELRAVMVDIERVVLDGATALARHTRALSLSFERANGRTAMTAA